MSERVFERAKQRYGGGLVAALGLTIIGALPGFMLAGLVDGDATIAVATVAAVGGALLAFVMPAGRVVLTLVLIAVGAVAAAVVATAVAPVASAESLLPATIDAITHGWSSTVRSPVPADADPRILVPLAMTSWSATATAVLLTRRQASTVAPLLPPISAVVAAVVAAGAQQYRPVAVGFGVLAGTAIYLVGRRPAAESARARSGAQIGMAAAIAVVVAAGASFAGPALAADREPFDVRDHWVPPAIPAGTTSPLDLVASRLQLADEPMFTIAADVPVTTRLAAFDTFDGTGWSTSGAFERTGAVLPGDRPSGVPVEPVDATIEITGLTGPWLPTVSEANRLDGAAVLVDPIGGSLVAANGDAAGARYELSAEVPRPDLVALQETPVATDPAAIAAQQIPAGVPAALREMSTVATEGGSSPLTKAALLELYLRTNFENAPEGVGGYSYGHLLRVLTVDGQGTPAQFAAAFAVLGRLAGLPTRLVVGFGPGTVGADGVYEVRAGDATVWPEVRFEGAGWVAFDPAPALGGSENGDGGGTVSIGAGPGSEVVVEPTEEPDDVGGDVGDGGDEATASSAGGERDAVRTWTNLALVGLGGLAALAALAAVAVALWKRRRTAHRRRHGDARDQVLGAWQDVMDRFREHGVEEPEHQTVDELVTGSEATSGALAGLYRPVNRALYDARPVSPEDAEQAWRARDRYVDALREQEPVHRRVRRSIDPRPLVRRELERR